MSEEEVEDVVLYSDYNFLMLERVSRYAVIAEFLIISGKSVEKDWLISQDAVILVVIWQLL